MRRWSSLLLVLATAACAQSDDDLKQQAARACGISPARFTLWVVRRNPATGKPEGVAYSGVDQDCITRWLSRKALNTISY